MADRGRVVRLTAHSFETPAYSHPLSFPVPYADLAPGSSKAFEKPWHLIQYVFELPDPELFPPLDIEIPTEDSRVLRRYVATSEELAAGSFLSYPVKMTMRFNQSDMWIEEQDFPSNEVIRGFSVLFRQISSQNEPASFNSAQRILRRLNGSETDEEYQRLRLDVLREWGRAVARLRAYQLTVLVGRKMEEREGIKLGVLPQEGTSPQELINTYHYGEDIHWGRHSEHLELIKGNSTFYTSMRRDFFDAVEGLSHVFLGFSLLVRAAMGEPRRGLS